MKIMPHLRCTIVQKEGANLAVTTPFLDGTPCKVYARKVSGKDFVKKLMKDGWDLDRVRGSHHIMRKNGVILSVPVHRNEDLKPGILNELSKKAGYKK